MAWSNLITQLKAYIKTNGNNEITGQVLQDVLVNIINNLGGLAGYKGIATPSTNPGAIDGNAFYLASQNGTYANFSGAILLNEIAVLYNTGSVWTKTTLVKTVGYANTPTATGDPEAVKLTIPASDRKQGYFLSFTDDNNAPKIQVYRSSNITDAYWIDESNWITLTTGAGDISELPVTFEENTEGLPASDDALSKLFGKIRYYLRVVIPQMQQKFDSIRLFLKSGGVMNLIVPTGSPATITHAIGTTEQLLFEFTYQTEEELIISKSNFYELAFTFASVLANRDYTFRYKYGVVGGSTIFDVTRNPFRPSVAGNYDIQFIANNELTEDIILPALGSVKFEIYGAVNTGTSSIGLIVNEFDAHFFRNEVLVNLSAENISTQARDTLETQEAFNAAIYNGAVKSSALETISDLCTSIEMNGSVRILANLDEDNNPFFGSQVGVGDQQLYNINAFYNTSEDRWYYTISAHSLSTDPALASDQYYMTASYASAEGFISSGWKKTATTEDIQTAIYDSWTSSY